MTSYLIREILLTRFPLNLLLRLPLHLPLHPFGVTLWVIMQ